jgi:hypothetical protein
MNSSAELDDRRRSPRINVKYDVSIVAADGSSVDGSTRGLVLNISKDGLCLKTVFQADVRSLISVSIIFGGYDSLVLTEVMWKRPDGSHVQYGLRFKQWSYLDPLLEGELAAKSVRVASKTAGQ